MLTNFIVCKNIDHKTQKEKIVFRFTVTVVLFRLVNIVSSLVSIILLSHSVDVGEKEISERKLLILNH